MISKKHCTEFLYCLPIIAYKKQWLLTIKFPQIFFKEWLLPKNLFFPFQVFHVKMTLRRDMVLENHKIPSSCSKQIQPLAKGKLRPFNFF